jgi:hypothetical protein
MRSFALPYGIKVSGSTVSLLDKGLVGNGPAKTSTSFQWGVPSALSTRLWTFGGKNFAARS